MTPYLTHYPQQYIIELFVVPRYMAYCVYRYIHLEIGEKTVHKTCSSTKGETWHSYSVSVD